MNADRNSFLTADDSALSLSCHWDFHKSSGNGGQKVNKTSSAVRLHHVPTGLTVNCSDSRSQTVNRHTALKRLRLQIALELREKPEPNFEFDPAPSVSAERYPLWCARLFDALADCNWDVKKCAANLNITRSRLDKMLLRDEQLFREFRRNKTKSSSARSQDNDDSSCG